MTQLKNYHRLSVLKIIATGLLLFCFSCAHNEPVSPYSFTISIGGGIAQQKVAIKGNLIAVESFYMDIESNQKSVSNWKGKLTFEQQAQLTSIVESAAFPTGESYFMEGNVGVARHWLVGVQKGDRALASIMVSGYCPKEVHTLLYLINSMIPPAFKFQLPAAKR